MKYKQIKNNFLSQLLSVVACCSYSILKTFEGEYKLLCLPANEHNGFVQVNIRYEAVTLSTELCVFYTYIHRVTPCCQNIQTVQYVMQQRIMLHYSRCSCNNNSTFLGYHADLPVLIMSCLYIGLITGKVLPMHNEVLILNCTRSQALYACLPAST